MLHKATEKKNVLTIRVVVIKCLLYEAKWMPQAPCVPLLSQPAKNPWRIQVSVDCSLVTESHVWKYTCFQIN